MYRNKWLERVLFSVVAEGVLSAPLLLLLLLLPAIAKHSHSAAFSSQIHVQTLNCLIHGFLCIANMLCWI